MKLKAIIVIVLFATLASCEREVLSISIHPLPENKEHPSDAKDVYFSTIRKVRHLPKIGRRVNWDPIGGWLMPGSNRFIDRVTVLHKGIMYEVLIGEENVGVEYILTYDPKFEIGGFRTGDIVDINSANEHLFGTHREGYDGEKVKYYKSFSVKNDWYALVNDTTHEIFMFVEKSPKNKRFW